MSTSEEEFRLIVETIPGLVAIMRADGAVEIVNRQVLEYFGRTLEELRNWGTTDSVHPDDLPRVVAAWRTAVETGTPFEFEHRIRRADGVYRWFQSRGLPLRGPDGRIERWYNLLTDIDQRRLAEERLRRSEAELLEAQRLSHAGSWRHVLTTGAVAVSPEMSRIRGLASDVSLTTTDLFDAIHRDDRPAVESVFETARVHRVDFEADYRIVLSDGAVRHLHTVGHPIADPSGEVVEFVGTDMDVTEQREAREELEIAYEQIKRLKDRLQDENVSLREEIDQAFMFGEIVGSSPVLRKVLASTSKVAPTDATVLISGETGTGKELIAREIHKRSRRAGAAFVSVNCAAIPAALIASELFGHEKGAFTGAMQQRRGRFELANGGTIFLDEIGEVPIDTQVALLRVLQERQIERIGGTRPIPVDVRVIAATNRNLPAATASGEFRSDLFYRLNVFPIHLPPLRERREDIPVLLEHFVKRFAEKMRKRVCRIGKRTLQLCEAYAWPGNVRELQNIVERAVILCGDDTLEIDDAWLPIQAAPSSDRPASAARTLRSQEREMIEAALADCRGKVAGSNGAAAMLGIPASTLESKIKLLEIDKSKFRLGGRHADFAR